MKQLIQEACPRQASSGSLDAQSWRRLYLRSTEEMADILTEIMDGLHLAGYSVQEAFGIRLALEEAIVNAIRHGHRFDASRQVEVRYRLTEDSLLVEVEDEGPGFVLANVPDPLAPENVEREGGRGLYLMRCYMTSVRYNDSGNCVTLYKRRSRSPAQEPQGLS
jgi:serine/threonine-protein kinase RsbW